MPPTILHEVYILRKTCSPLFLVQDTCSNPIKATATPIPIRKRLLKVILLRYVAHHYRSQSARRTIVITLPLSFFLRTHLH